MPYSTWSFSELSMIVFGNWDGSKCHLCLVRYWPERLKRSTLHFLVLKNKEVCGKSANLLWRRRLGCALPVQWSPFSCVANLDSGAQGYHCSGGFAPCSTGTWNFGTLRDDVALPSEAGRAVDRDNFIPHVSHDDERGMFLWWRPSKRMIYQSTSAPLGLNIGVLACRLLDYNLHAVTIRKPKQANKC